MERLSDEWLDRAEAGEFHISNRQIAPILRKIPEAQRKRVDSVAWVLMNSGHSKVEAYDYAVNELIASEFRETPLEREIRYRGLM